MVRLVWVEVQREHLEPTVLLNRGRRCSKRARLAFSKETAGTNRTELGSHSPSLSAGMGQALLTRQTATAGTEIICALLVRWPGLGPHRRRVMGELFYTGVLPTRRTLR